MTAFDGMREAWEALPLLQPDRLTVVQLPTAAVQRGRRRRDLGLALAIAAAVLVVDLVLWSLLDLVSGAAVLGQGQGGWIIAAESGGAGVGAWMALRWRRPS